MPYLFYKTTDLTCSFELPTTLIFHINFVGSDFVPKYFKKN